MNQGYRQKCLAQKINACNVCGTGGELVVHHINGDRDDNRLENLVPLCDSCHKSVHLTIDPAGTVGELQAQLPDEMKPDSGGMVHPLTVRIDSELASRLESFKDSREFEPNTSDIVRTALEKYLDEEGV